MDSSYNPRFLSIWLADGICYGIHRRITTMIELFCIIEVITIAFLLWWFGQSTYPFEIEKYKFVSMTPKDNIDHDKEMVLKRIRGDKEDTVVVRGSCTVWHYYPSGKRCGTRMEAMLCDFWQAEKWRQEEK
jgi:hypothetical protein